MSAIHGPNIFPFHFQLENGPNAPYFNTLKLFAYGTYKQYLENKEQLLELTPLMIKKLQHLTIVTMAIRSKVIKYKDLLVELDIKNVRDLEDLIIEAIYAGSFFCLSSIRFAVQIENTFCRRHNSWQIGSTKQSIGSRLCHWPGHPVE